MTWLQKQIKLRKHRFIIGFGNNNVSEIPIPPTIVIWLAQAGSADAIDVEWTYETDPLLDFQIQYDTDEGFGDPTTVSALASQRQIALGPGLSPVEYFIKIRARNSIDKVGAWSDSQSVDLSL